MTTIRHQWPARNSSLMVGMVGCYLLISWLKTAGLSLGRLEWYLADLLCLPLVLGFVLQAHRLVRRSPGLILPRWHGLTAVVFYTAYFEGVLPRLKAGAVADPYDAVAYLLGWVLFEILLNRKEPPPEGRGSLVL